MYIVKNAYKSIIRTKGRNILIFILVLLIAVSACVALSVRNNAESAKMSAYNSLTITAQINTNRQGIMGGGKFDRDSMMGQLSQSLTLEEMNFYAQSEYVDNFYYSTSVGMNVLDGFTIYDTSSSSSFGFSNFGSGMMGGSRNMSDITVIGYSSHDAMTTFINGENVICDGSVFEQNSTDNTCVISYELALLNDLSVGDAIQIYNPQKEEQAYTLTVCGIFQNKASDAYANTVFMSYLSLNAIIEDTINYAEESENNYGMTISTALRAVISGTYVFTDIERYENFCADVEMMGLNTEIYTVSSIDINQYEKSVVPLESLGKFTMLFFIVVLLVGGGILVIFNMFTVRERKYEIGVLAAIGMKKEKVAAQFLIEAFLVTFTAIIVGAGIGAAISQPIGDYLLQEQIASVETTANTMSMNFGGQFQGSKSSRFGNFAYMQNPNNSNFPAPIEYSDTLAATTDFTVLLNLMGISLLLTVIASSVGMISVLRYEPLKILSER